MAAAPEISHRIPVEPVRRIVVTVAPVAHAGTHLPDGTVNPIAPQEIARECRRCADAGATVAHLHVRDLQGAIVSELTHFRLTLDLVFQQTRLIINGSTGGASELSREERCVSLTDPRVELASLNMGSTNFGEGVYVNTLDDVRYWAGRIRAAGVVPELEVFGSSMIASARMLQREGVLAPPLHYNFCLGFPGAAPAEASELVHLARTVPAGSVWGFLHEGMTDLRLMALALGLGAGGLRVGYEDGGYLRGDRPAKSNAELVEQLVRLIRAAGCEPATYEEARSILGLDTTDGGRQVK